LWLHSLGEEIGDDHAIIRQQRDLDGAGITGESGSYPFQIGFL
jgi:hypothetical protein